MVSTNRIYEEEKNCLRLYEPVRFLLIFKPLILYDFQNILDLTAQTTCPGSDYQYHPHTLQSSTVICCWSANGKLTTDRWSPYPATSQYCSKAEEWYLKCAQSRDNMCGIWSNWTGMLRSENINYTDIDFYRTNTKSQENSQTFCNDYQYL